MTGNNKNNNDSQDGVEPSTQPMVCVIGAGPAGLMTAEVLSEAGVAVHVYDAMPSVGRKFLLAGKGGLNLTHSEPFDRFMTRFGDRAEALRPWLEAFGPQALCEWVQGLGIQTFVGSSGRVFPTDMKAAPLLRAWLQRLRSRGVQFHMRHRWTGWTEDGQWRFATPTGELQVQAQEVVLALGGGSWSRLGSDGAWLPWLQEQGCDVAPLQPSNCGFDRPWTEFFSSRFAGQPFKSVALHFDDGKGQPFARRGEFVATAGGIEGSLVYAASAAIRDAITTHGSATVHIDLLPDRSPEQVLAAVRHPRGARSLSSHLKSRLGIDGIKTAILHEELSREEMLDAERLATTLKALPLKLVAARPIDEAISSAGGVRLEGLDANLMLRERPGVFVAGEMLDWEAPTGGYLLTASMATGRGAGLGLLARLRG